MKTKQTIALFCLTIFTAFTTACTTQSWYEGVKQGAENNCRNQPTSASERCLDNLNKETYEAYEKERSGQK